VYYRATIVQVSTAKRRASAPLKVHYAGYTEDSDEWVGIDRIRSRAVKGKAKAKAATKARSPKEPADTEAKQSQEESEDGAEKPGSRVPADEVILAAWVIPVETEGALHDHAVVISDGKILDILPSTDAVKKYKPKRTSKLPHAALMPGFVNAHTHTPMVYLRGVSDDLPLREWLEGTIWPLEFKFVNHEFVKEGADLAITEMLKGGTTTFNDMYWFPEAVCESVVKSGIRAAVGIIAIEFPFAGYGSGPDEYFAKGQQAREKYADEPRISWTVSLHAPYTCSDGTITKGRELSEKLEAPLHIHLHETSAEVEESKAGNKDSQSCHMSDEKSTPLANLKRLGAVNKRLVAVHMNYLTDAEVEMLAAEGASVVHCPSSGLKLASGFCRVADLEKAGVNVAIGTDGASSNNTLDMMAEMKLAAILAKAVAKDASAVPAQQAMRMATLNGAKALGLDSVTGSIAVGKDADMIAVDFDTPPTWPAPTVAPGEGGFDPITHIVYSSTRDQVTNVWVKGRRLMRHGRVLSMDVDGVKKVAQKWGQKITEACAELKQKK